MHSKLNQQLEPSASNQPSMDILQEKQSNPNASNQQHHATPKNRLIKKKDISQNQDDDEYNDKHEDQIDDKQINQEFNYKIHGIGLINTQIKEQYRIQVLEALNQINSIQEDAPVKSVKDNGQLFKRTDSFYEDQQQCEKNKQIDQQIIIQNNPIMNNVQQKYQPDLQPVPYSHTDIQVSEPPQRNHYKKCLRQANKFLKIMRISYYINLFRFMLIGLIYYNVEFMIPQPANSPYPNTNTETNSTYSSQVFNDTRTDIPTDAKAGYYQPWNIMVYFLSGSIDMISLIGYVSSIRFLKNQIKLLQNKAKRQDQRLERQKLKENVINENNYNQQPQNLQDGQQQIENQRQNRIGRRNLFANHSSQILRAGRQFVYMSVYSMIRQYKYKNRDQAAAFKISKAMHFFATFLFFGRMALIQQFQFQSKINGRQWDNFLKQSILWFFLLTAYINTFQIDFNVIQNSSGLILKCKVFISVRLVKNILTFKPGDKSTQFVLKLVLFQVITGVILNTDIFSILTFCKILVIILVVIIIRQNKITINNSKKYLTYIKYQQFKKSAHKMQQNAQRQQGQRQNMINFNNLTLLGILQRHSSKSDGTIYSFYRCFMFFYILALLRESQPTTSQQILVFCFNFFVVIVFCGVQYYKFRKATRQKLNLLTSCKYEQVKQILQQKEQKIEKGQKIQLEMQDVIKKNEFQVGNVNSSINNQSSCSVCLIEYQSQENVIILCCGHIFHDSCLFDWLKQKKQCPLCRLNIQQYYKQVEF